MVTVKRMKDIVRLDPTKCIICGYPFDGGSLYLTLNGQPVGDVCESCFKDGDKVFTDRLNERIKDLKDERLTLTKLLAAKVKY